MADGDGEVVRVNEAGVEGCRDALVVDAQPIVEVLENAGHGPGTDLDVEGGEFGCDLLGGTAGPTDAGDGVAGDIVLQGRFDGSDHLGRFFPGVAARHRGGARARARRPGPAVAYGPGLRYRGRYRVTRRSGRRRPNRT